MSLWEYKVITSGKGGFATPALMEKFLNDLGRDEWEIVHFQTPAENFLAFTGLARRSTQRDWTLQDAAAAAAKAEADKLRAEFEAKFKAGAGSTAANGPEERAPSFLEEKVAPDDGFRKPVDTSHDDEPDSEEEDKADEWDKLTAAEEDELPTFFEAIKPHMRRNQRGPGMSVGVDYLAKKWDQPEEDLKAALAECGFVVPSDEDAKAEYLEYDGDLYWLNVNRRGELWINTKEKPRPVFRPVKAARVEIETPAPKEAAGQKDESRGTSDAKTETIGEASPPESAIASDSGEVISEGEKPSQGGGRPGRSDPPSTPLPDGSALLDKIRPHMRRNRRGPGGSGSASFLSRALRTNEADLRTAFGRLGLTVPSKPSDKAVYSEFGNEVWWLNLDSRGGLWINGREKKEGESITQPSDEATADAPLEAVPGSGAPDAVPAPEVAAAAASSDDLGDQMPGSEAGPAETAAPASNESTMPVAPTEQPATAEKPLPVAEANGLETVGAGESEPPEANANEDTPVAVSVNSALAAVRVLLKETKTGAVAAKVDRLADELGKPPEEFVAALVDAGLRVPEKPREKPVFVSHGGEILWLNKNAKGELWLNAKAPRVADATAEGDEGEDATEPSEGGEGEGEKKPRRGARVRTKKLEGKESSDEKAES
jgi:hypothetical protein